MNDLSAPVFTALIADDEPLLLEALARELLSVWPELSVSAKVSNGDQALKKVMSGQFDIAFLDIRMPGASGIEVARDLIQSWPGSPGESQSAWPPLLVFVTAYGEFAVDAFDNAAVDYLLKPVTAARLHVCVERLKARLLERRNAVSSTSSDALRMLGEQLRHLSGAVAGGQYLQVIRAAVGDSVRMIPIDEVLMLEAADKYVLVHTAGGEALIRESLRDLLGQLDPAVFQQIHRSAIINMTAVELATRDSQGRLVLRLQNLKQEPIVSRQYTHLFKAM